MTLTKIKKRIHNIWFTITTSTEHIFERQLCGAQRKDLSHARCFKISSAGLRVHNMHVWLLAYCPCSPDFLNKKNINYYVKEQLRRDCEHHFILTVGKY